MQRRDEDDTERISGPGIFAEEARSAAERLVALELLFRKRIDLGGDAAAVQQLIDELNDLAHRFDMWPKLEGATVAFERKTMTRRLVVALKEAVRMLRSVPTTGPLGRVPNLPSHDKRRK